MSAVEICCTVAEAPGVLKGVPVRMVARAAAELAWRSCASTPNPGPKVWAKSAGDMSVSKSATRPSTEICAAAFRRFAEQASLIAALSR